MIILAKMGLGFMGTAVVGGAMLCSEGFMSIKVHEKQPGGTNVYVVLPAAIVPAALEFVPNHHLAKASEQVQQYMPIIDAALPALEECPDGVLVEVVDPNEHVLVTKKGGSVVVDVNDSTEVVHVAVPLRAAMSTLHEIAEANGRI
jgi:hypothetical protein